MSLNWDITKVAHIPSDADARSAFYDQPNEEGTTYVNATTGEPEAYDNWAVLETLIWRTMAVDLGGITKDNVAKFIERSEIWERLMGGLKISRLSIYKHIGLVTNVTSTTDAAYWRKLRSILERDVTNVQRWVSDRQVLEANAAEAGTTVD